MAMTVSSRSLVFGSVVMHLTGTVICRTWLSAERGSGLWVTSSLPASSQSVGCTGLLLSWPRSGAPKGEQTCSCFLESWAWNSRIILPTHVLLAKDSIQSYPRGWGGRRASLLKNLTFRSSVHS